MPVVPPLNPRTHSPDAPQGLSSFARLARVHAASAAGDAMIAVALADSLFFSDPSESSRGSVLLYLLVTLLPFALVAPFIGPALDRVKGGRRILILLLNAGRALTAFFLIGNVDSLILYPLAFAILVLGKGYAIAKAAVVPATVSSEEELVDKNSRLAVLTVVAGLIGALPAWLFARFLSADWAVGMAGFSFLFAAVLSARMPKAEVLPTPQGVEAVYGGRKVGIRMAATSMGVLRAVLGFMTFLLAFHFRTENTWALFAAAALAMLGTLSGSAVVAKVEESNRAEWILQLTLLISTFVCMLAIWTGDIQGALAVAFVVGLCVSGGKVAFDSVVQRDAPNANYGRSFGQFEVFFQLMWVFGALLGLIPIPLWAGFMLMTLATGGTGVLYLIGVRQLGRSQANDVANLPAPKGLGDILRDRWRIHRRSRSKKKTDQSPG